MRSLRIFNVHAIILPMGDDLYLIYLSQIAESDELWEMIYIDHSESPVTEELSTLAEAIGWKKLFFTNKLQLQVDFDYCNGYYIIHHLDTASLNYCYI